MDDGPISEAIKELMKTYVQYPPRKMQSMTYTGPVTLSNYQKFQWVREQLRRRVSTFRCQPAIRLQGIRTRAARE